MFGKYPRREAGEQGGRWVKSQKGQQVMVEEGEDDSSIDPVF